MPTVAVDNKKKAKANAAMACLQQMGLVPKDPDNPVWENHGYVSTSFVV